MRIPEELQPLAVPISELTLDPCNARRRDARALAALADSLDRFGQHRLAVVQRVSSGHLVVRIGNGMVAAAEALGWEEIAVLEIEEGDEEAMARALADNRTAELSEWDPEVLGGVLAEVAAAGEQAIGWAPDEVESVLAGVGSFDGVEPMGDSDPLPDLNGSAGHGIHTMTFTLTEDQKETVEEALRRAPEVEGTGNQNRNGNALATIAAAYLAWVEE